MIRIELKYNRGFAWHSRNGMHVKGFVYSSDGSYLAGEDLLNYFDADKSEDFRARVKAANGMFSVIRKTGKEALPEEAEVLMAVDFIRTFPLFYAGEGEDIFISDSADRIQEFTGYTIVDPLVRAEFLAAGLVTGSDTLISGIRQVQAGEILNLRNGDEEGAGDPGEFYYSYQTGSYHLLSLSGLQEKLYSELTAVFTRLVDSMQDRCVMVPLSGGYDSRLIACMLKELGHKNVITFTYGREGNPDMEVSRQVAEKLDFEWHNIVYDDDLIAGFVEDGDFQEYYRYSSNLTSMFFMQEYFAVQQLKKRGLVPEDAVFVPGHSGDFLGGSQFIKHGLKEGLEDIPKISERLYRIKYALCPPGRKEVPALKKRLIDGVSKMAGVPGAYSHSIHEDWDMKEKLARFIVNSCNVYSWFGYEYRLPFWDKELVDFFRQVPYEYKLNKLLYDSVAREKIFEKWGVNFENEIQPSARLQRSYKLKSSLRSLIPGSMRRLIRSDQDDLYYHEITGLLKEDLQKKDIRIEMQNNSYNSLIVQWYIEQIAAK